MTRPNSHTHLPRALYTAAQVRALDAQLIEQVPISSLKLMRRAASVVLSVIHQRWPQLRRLQIFTGSGNNGGDGYYLAAIAASEGIKVQVLECAGEPRKGDAATARMEALAAGVSCKPCDPLLDLVNNRHSQDTVLVDAIVGTGFQGPLRKGIAEIIEWMNHAGLPVVSVDVPSGVESDTGHVADVAVRASMTVCLVGLKQGLFTGRGPDHVGDVVFHDLGMPEIVKTSELANAPASHRLDIHAVSGILTPRAPSTHKGHCGNVLVIGGDHGLGGAALMAAEAAARAGAGTVSLVTRFVHVAASLARRPEIMVRGIDDPEGQGAEQVHSLIEKANAIVIGPGLGNSPWSHVMLRVALSARKTVCPVVLDADALNLLAEYAALDLSGHWAQTFPLSGDHWVLTPHPGEAARLLQCSVAQIQQDRFAAARALRARYGGAIVLKGAGSVLCLLSVHPLSAPDKDQVAVCTEGNPGMATGGMGDVLSGLTGGLIAQGLPPSVALQCAVAIHGEAADLAAETAGERGMLACDLMPYIRQLANGR